MFCYKCGKQVLDGAPFCAFCGTKQVAGNDEPSSVKVSKYTKEEQTNIVGMAAELTTIIQIEEEEYKRLESEQFTVLEPLAPKRSPRPVLSELAIPPKPVRPKAPEKIPFSEFFPEPVRPQAPQAPQLKTVNKPQYVTPAWPDAQLKEFDQWAIENSGFNRFLFNGLLGSITFICVLPIILFGLFGFGTDLAFAKAIALAHLIAVIVLNLYAHIIKKNKLKKYNEATKQINSDAYTEGYHMAFSSAVNDANTKNQKIKAAYEAQCRAAQEQYNKEIYEYNQAIQRYPLALKEYEKALEEWKAKEPEKIDAWNSDYNEKLKKWSESFSRAEKDWEIKRTKELEDRDNKYRERLIIWENDWNMAMDSWNRWHADWDNKRKNWQKNNTAQLSFIKQDLAENNDALEILLDNTQLIPSDYRTIDRLLWLYEDMSTSEHDIERAIDLLNHKETSDLLKSIRYDFDNVRSVMKEGFSAVYSDIQKANSLLIEAVDNQKTMIANQNKEIANQNIVASAQTVMAYGQAAEIDRLNTIIENQDASNALNVAMLVQQNEMFSTVEKIRRSARTSNFLIGGSLLASYIKSRRSR